MRLLVLGGTSAVGGALRELLGTIPDATGSDARREPGVRAVERPGLDPEREAEQLAA